MNNECKDMQKEENGKMTLEELRRIVTEMAWEVKDRIALLKAWGILERAWEKQQLRKGLPSGWLPEMCRLS